MNKSRINTGFILPLILFFIVAIPLLIGILAIVSHFVFHPAFENKALDTITEIKNSNFEFESEIKTASGAYYKGNYQEQLKSSESALTKAKSDKEKGSAYYWKGLAEYKLNTKEQSQSNLETSLKFYPDNPGPYVTLAAIELDKQNYQKALELAQKCAQLDPKYAWCHNNIGLSLHYLGRSEEAIKELETAATLDPESVVFQDNLKRLKENIQK